MIEALVSHYLTNQLIIHRPISKRPKPLLNNIHLSSLRGINPSFPRLSPTLEQIIYALLTRPPLYIFPKEV